MHIHNQLTLYKWTTLVKTSIKIPSVYVGIVYKMLRILQGISKNEMPTPAHVSFFKIAHIYIYKKCPHDT
jgi:hypothetical protein